MFRDLLAARTQEFVEEILAPHFGGLISWVKDSEVVLERGQGDRLAQEESEPSFPFCPLLFYRLAQEESEPLFPFCPLLFYRLMRIKTSISIHAKLICFNNFTEV